MDIRQQLRAAFAIEHREHLDAIRAALGAAGAGQAPDWADVFRRAHSLKGASRAVDLPPVEAVAHRLETLFERIAEGDHALDRDTIGAIDLALDRIEAFVAESDSGEATMPADALAALERCLGTRAAAPVAPPAMAAAPEPLPQAAPDTGADQGPAFLRVPAASVEALTQAAHGLAGALQGEAPLTESLARIAAEATALRARVQALRGRELRADAARAELAAIDNGLAALTRGVGDAARLHRSVVADLDGASARVREEAERIALVPAETAFGGFTRAIREIARGEGREVEISVRGLDLPVERGMLQALRDPVMHALRNALSHGAEAPEARRRAGKPPALGILFEVAARGGRLVIGVHDDGRGVDLRRIETRARERGLVGAEEPAPPERLLALAFEPGFSTAEAVDTLSGRGIGLSVVADAVRRLRGSVRLEPRTPFGTSLILDLPLSAARRPVLLVEAGGATYALPGTAVERMLLCERTALESVAGRLLVRVGEGEAAATLPLTDLAGLVEPGARSEGGARIPAILVRATTRRFVLAVDALSEVATRLILPAPALGTDPGLVAGTVLAGHDRPVLLLDPDGLAVRLDRSPLPASAIGIQSYTEKDGTLDAKRRSTILVVDDSITTRTLEKSILEAAGYRVVVCVDGQDALDRLHAGIEPVDLVVADVEMPRLDGFGLLEALRGESAFATLPVILMTSRGASQDVARGLELGADAYLTKQKFDQRELLDTIGQLL